MAKKNNEEELAELEKKDKEEKHWYVVNTYSGHEYKVKENLEKRVATMGLQDVLFNIVIPERVETEIKKGKKQNKPKVMFPGYVLVEMIMTDEAWYVVRNTSGVTGFIGSSGGGAKPFPINDAEVHELLRSMGISSGIVTVDFEVGDRVKVISGLMIDKEGMVESIDLDKEKAIVLIDFLGSSKTPIELDLINLEKID